jgi:hypothetical protein
MQFRPTPSPQSPDPDGAADGGGFVDTPDTGNPDAGTVDTDTPAADTGADANKAGSMLEAMFGQKQAAPSEAEVQEAAATGKTVQQLRDERGRFAGKAPDQQGQQPLKPGQPDPKAKPDPNAMPEGLTAKAQERFQALANTNKELTARVAEFQPIVESAKELQQTFHENGIKREQFEQAMQVVGLMNRGDLRGALAALDEQRRLIALHLGQPVPGIDMLQNHADLQAMVDNLQTTRELAEEAARGREQRALSQQQNAQRQQQESRQQQEQQQRADQAQQAHRSGVLAVEEFSKKMQASDMDFARIEPLLLKEIQGGLLQGTAPQHWAALIQKTYNLIKQTASQTRAAGGATPPVLRPTGGEAPTAQPRNAYEAMWGKSKPAGA